MMRTIWTVLLVALLLFTDANIGNAMTGIGQGEDELCPTVYTVKPGDSLRAIAERCDTTVSQLLFDNPLIDPAQQISAGQRIYLPAVVSSPPANAAAVPVAAVPVTGKPAEAEDIIDTTAASEPAVAASQADEDQQVVYRVKRGDSLGKIARQLGTSMEVLLLANPKITNPNRIYVNQELRIPGEAELAALQSERERQQAAQQRQVVEMVGLANERWIDVNLDEQKVRAYEGRELVQTFTVSTGTWRTPTVTGQYDIWIKLEYDDMRGPGYYLENVPYVMYFHKGYGLHGTYWHSNFGTPMSHGCVNLQTDDARWLFEFAEVGTLVNVH